MTATGPEELLRRRARELARPLPTGREVGAAREVMRFRLGDESYAVSLHTIRQVVPLTGAARLPRDAWPLVALAPVGGNIVPVVALERSRADAVPSARTPWAIAVAAAGTVLCLPADEVTGLVDLGDADLTAEGQGDGDPRARGLTRDGDILIDVGALVASVEGQPADRRSGAAGPADVGDQG